MAFFNRCPRSHLPCRALILRRPVVGRRRAHHGGRGWRGIPGGHLSRSPSKFAAKISRHGCSASDLSCRGIFVHTYFWNRQLHACMVHDRRGLVLPDLLASAVFKGAILHRAAGGPLSGNAGFCPSESGVLRREDPQFLGGPICAHVTATTLSRLFDESLSVKLVIPATGQAVDPDRSVYASS